MAGARLVVFDLDGTITYHDTLVPYVIGYLRQRPWRLFRLVLVLPAVLAFVLRIADHGKVKAALLRATLRGRTRAELQHWTEQFVPRLIAAGMRTQALEAVAEHRRRGDHLVLLSASPDLYVPTIARQLGFAEWICTGVSWEQDRLVGNLTTANRRGDEKTRCFRELRERFPGVATVAYANGPSDLDHLSLSDDRMLVNAPLWVRRKAAHRGIPCGEWR